MDIFYEALSETNKFPSFLLDNVDGNELRHIYKCI